MSTKGIFVGLSGAMAQNLKLDSIANNIANVDSPAFKRDQQLFKEYLTANEKPPSVIQVPKIPASIESFYDTQGGDKSFVDTAGTFTDFTQGGLKVTGNSFDVAIEGEGFFEVATPSGARMTRNGSFTLDGNGQLVTKQGYPVLMQSPGGTELSQRVIRLGSGPITIGSNGQVFQNGQEVATLSIVNVADKDVLHKEGSGLFNFKDNAVAETTQVTNPNLHQGYLETSNINIVKEMTDMITTNRHFETLQKAMSTYDQMNEKLVNEVSKV